MASGSKVMCRKKVDTPWSIYLDFTVGKKQEENQEKTKNRP